MSAEFHFHLKVLAPAGLAGIEANLGECGMNLHAYRSGFNGHVILKPALGEERFEFGMQPSTDAELHASGTLFLNEQESWGLLVSLSEALKHSIFPHVVGMDDANGNPFRKIRHEM